MQRTTNQQTTITISTTEAKPKADNSIRKVTVYGRGGRAQVIEKVRGITI